MCGIAGFIDVRCGTRSEELRAAVGSMASAIRHRGPDDSGCWVDEARGIALGHRRLSVVDLSPWGHQPMESHCGRYVLVYNGEIYNYPSIREELLKERRPPAFRGHSDTEVFLAAIGQWGLQETLRRSNGMFAFALWDRQECILSLGRDRIGEKPLYYGWAPDTFLFASELKALHAHMRFQGEIDRDVTALYLRYGYFPAPYTVYKGIYKIPPACVLQVSGRQEGSFSPFPSRHGFDPSSPFPYWSAQDVAERGIAEPFRGTVAEAVGQLDDLLRDAVNLRMLADVPVGAFLSGGIDSSTVVALMQAQSGRPVRTFSIGFHDAQWNEAGYARRVAEHLGTQHEELYVTPAQTLDVLPNLPVLYDEPLADPSQIPTALVSQFARGHVTVSLSGDGGDELFCGYPSYDVGPHLWSILRMLPASLRSAGARSLRRLPSTTCSQMPGWLRALLAHGCVGDATEDGFHRLARILDMRSFEALCNTMVSRWRDLDAVMPGALELPTALTDPELSVSFKDLARRMMFRDLVTYLPDDILAKVDRASMGVSLEVRVPLLDHRVVEFAWRIPRAMARKDGRGKWLLRQVLARYVPEALFDRPKAGFGMPIAAWLRGPLRDWAEPLLDPTHLEQRCLVNPEPIRRRWREHLEHTCNRQNELWTVLMLSAWVAHHAGSRPRLAAPVCV